MLFSPSSQGRPPRSNCSEIKPALRATNFNAVATAAVSLTQLLASRFPAAPGGDAAGDVLSGRGK